jgi:hypothetical protein
VIIGQPDNGVALPALLQARGVNSFSLLSQTQCLRLLALWGLLFAVIMVLLVLL